jgi:hypothetical protein
MVAMPYIEDQTPSVKKTPKRKISNSNLTPKQRAFVDHLVNNPKASATQAASVAYNASSRNVAKSIATENLSKPAIITELAQYTNLVENTIINTVQDWGNSENTRRREIAVESAKWVHDKVHGRASQKIISESKLVKISINLTGDGELPPEGL